ncbi:hypothetical protein GA0115233_103017 [Streptomyces sp. DI166]|uniref:hypothetical protein n=1 Tax=Streptomyces sp. DI166 TaxID=1839783 RepID=UPI0007F43117|nr:hypothetical protein [Streptomyces sp. DI166]SBT91385.1 hypothetical protein GA0115233_103017 [Streptomyces sp. DI166]
MSARGLRQRLDRLERGTPSAQALGVEVLALVDAYIEDGGDLAELLPLFGLAPGGEASET